MRSFSAEPSEKRAAPKSNSLIFSVSAYENIVGADVAVDNTCPVDWFQRLCDANQNLQRAIAAYPALIFAELVREGAAFQEFHDHVRSPVFLKKIKHMDNMLFPVKLGRVPRFVQKPRQALLKFPGSAPGIQEDLALARDAVHDPDRIVFLDGHLSLQLLIPGAVQNAEASEAHHMAKEIPAFLQPHARTELVWLLWLSCHRMAA